MDLGNVIYIIAIIAYFIYQATKGKKDKMSDPNAGGAPSQEERPVTFEDLLKEIRQAQSPKAAPPVPKSTLEPVKPSRGFESTYEKPKSDSTYHKPESTYTPRESSYEKPASTYQKPTSTYEKPSRNPDSRKSWYDTNDDEITYYEGAYEQKVHARASDVAPIGEIPSLQIERSEQNSEKINPYAQLLKNPKSVRDAVVLSEILNKKHF